jgi:hypothetical protein
VRHRFVLLTCRCSQLTSLYIPHCIALAPVILQLQVMRHLQSHDNTCKVIDLIADPPTAALPAHMQGLFIVTEGYKCTLATAKTSSATANTLETATAQHFKYTIYQASLMRSLHSVSHHRHFIM